MTSSLGVIILTKNESVHLERCLDALKGLNGDIIICDSGSTDETLDIARRFSVDILENPWVNYSRQFNWALEMVGRKYDWILRVDADEVVSRELIDEINKIVVMNNMLISGYLVQRSMTFMSERIKFGGVFPGYMLRLFRSQEGHCEQRWMDEHIVVNGNVGIIKIGEIMDDSRKSLTFWIEKHNWYASREAVDCILNDLGVNEEISCGSFGHKNAIKRSIKDKVYKLVPFKLRAFVYFFYRYVFRLGFLDKNFAHDFHFLQAFWYRYLVDMKIEEVRRYAEVNDCHLFVAIKACLGIDVEANHGEGF